jgi:putative transposase
MCTQYPTDLTDGQWKLIQPLLPKVTRRGRPPIDRRRILNAILYVVRTGCQWRMLPREFPHWKTVYNCFWLWRRSGLWQRIHDRLRERVRTSVGKRSTPTVAIIDSQSAKSSEGGEFRGYDAGKKVSGRKRHIAVDTLGLILAVVVCGADWQDQDGACLVLNQLRHFGRRLKVVFGDSAYGRNGLPAWVKATFGWTLQTVLRPVKAKGFVVLPKRWIVERTFAWLSRQRRLARDYERTMESGEAFIHIAMIGVMVRRLAT